MNVQKEARRDAKEYARAQMFYGEGAGTRRKLISATVDGKALRSPAYARAFHKEYGRQDMAEHASKAHRERELKDKSESFGKNARGLITGDYRSVNSGVLVVAAVAYFAHQTGLDIKLYEKGKVTYRRVRDRIKYRNVTNINR